MKVKILKSKSKPFPGDQGNDIPYFWYDAVRLDTETKFQFGSRDGGHDIGSEYDLEIYKSEDSGKWKEVVSTPPPPIPSQQD